jgi:hypothetical protein
MKITCTLSAVVVGLAAAGGGHHGGGGGGAFIGGIGGYRSAGLSYQSYGNVPIGRIGGYRSGIGSIGGYSAGGYGGGVGAYGNEASRYAALAVEASSSATTVGAYNTYAYAPGRKHGMAVAAPLVEKAVVQQFVENDGQTVNKEVNAYARKKSYTVTHKPVYHKTVYNTYTAHDTVQKDVYHHLHENEARNFDVDGEAFHAGALNVDHGTVDYAPEAYQALVAGGSEALTVGTQQGYQGQVNYGGRGQQPNLGSFPSQPNFGSFPSQPNVGAQGLGSFPTQPDLGSFP